MSETKARDCPVCHGPGTVKPTKTDWASAGDNPLIIRNMPALVCTICGDETYLGDAIGMIESIQKGERRPTAFLRVPVYDLEVPVEAPVGSPRGEAPVGTSVELPEEVLGRHLREHLREGRIEHNGF